MSKVRTYRLKQPTAKRTYRVAYDTELNAEQYDVVMAPDGPILVIAGAGSGKTRTLTYRVSRLIEDGVDPSDILVLTFTNKAAREMLSRVEMVVSTDTRRIWGGTFHSTGNRILRRYAETIGFQSGFTILDAEDAKEMMEAAASDSGIATLDRRFPKGDVLLDIHSSGINTRTDLQITIDDFHPHFLECIDDIRKVFLRYEQKKRAANSMDFDDLLVHWKRLLDDHPDVASVLRQRFRHILVDEYQDTNLLQAEIVDAMAAERRNVMVVGDDAQAIYSFRGASFENILTFPVRYPDATIHKLETNYRSTRQILELANASIACNRFQFRKELTSIRGDGPEPAAVGTDDVYEQANFVAQRILELRDEGTDLAEIAVLYRSHYQSLELQMELSRRGIPFEVRSGVKFFEQAHVKDVLAYLKLVINPRDELAWKRVLKLYPKIGERTAAGIWSHLSTMSDPLEGFLRGPISPAGRTQKTSLDALRQLLRIVSGEGMRRNPSEAVRLIVEHAYADFARVRFPNAQARLDDLEQLAQYALRYEDLATFLDELALASPIAGEDVAVVGAEDEKVVLSSVHQAKGLEWNAVFVIWLADGRFPSARSLRVPGGIVRIRRDRPIPGIKLLEGFDDERDGSGDDQETQIVIPGEEEERRLFYVAVTRARRELYLVFPVMARDRQRIDVLMEPSRFLREIPDELMEKWVIESQRRDDWA